MIRNIPGKYFPELTELQASKLSSLEGLYRTWNSRINVISRKDMENFYVHHVLHSLSVAKVISFSPGTEVLDLGTGGGFPGIPLAIMFPATKFTLLDSIGKKIGVVTAIAEELGLQNAVPVCARAEKHRGNYDFVISRAVADFSRLVKMSAGLIRKEKPGHTGNGIIALKGGDLTDELKKFTGKVKLFPLSSFFDEPYFDSKYVVYLPVNQ